MNLQQTFANTSSCFLDKKAHKIFEFTKKNCASVNKIINFTQEEWQNKINTLNSIEKGQVKDYYLSFLHTIDKAGSGQYSYFLSTSVNKKQADWFRHNSGIILVGWTNAKNIYCSGIEEELKDKVSKLGFPTFNSKVYSKQMERTLKCGILPHYIVGYHYVDLRDNGADKFEINPYILKINNFSNVRVNGLPVDQTYFNEKIKKTNFKSHYLFCDDLYWPIDIS